MGPSSPSRLRSDRFDGRRTYFRRSWRSSPRFWLALAALLMAIPWPARWLLGRGDAPLTRGPLAGVHAAWDQQCAACHRDASYSDVWSAVTKVHDRWQDFTCDRCHGQAVVHSGNAPLAVHHPNLKWDLPLNRQCGECHHDHQGRNHSLTRLDDSSCTRCHDGRLSDFAHRTKETLDASSFVVDHPEFQKLVSRTAGSPGGEHGFQRRMRFSHSLHMTPGISYGGPAAGASRQKTLSDLGELAEQYRLPDQTDDLVRLQCRSCHRLDSERSGVAARRTTPGAESLFVARAAGAHMLPINFDLHCRACHPLDASFGRGAGMFEVQGLPHRLQPEDLESWLRTALTAKAIEREPELKSASVLDGRLDERGREARKTRLADLVRAGVSESRKALYLRGGQAAVLQEGGLCVKCHEMTAATADRPAQIVPPDIPGVWFEKARFRHAAHRAMSCADCHPHRGSELDDDGRPKLAPDEHEPIGKVNGEWHGFVGIDSCRACHRPLDPGGRSQSSPAILGGVRHACTDCHSYHNGGAPLHGIGSPWRDPPTKGLSAGAPVD